MYIYIYIYVHLYEYITVMVIIIRFGKNWNILQSIDNVNLL